MEASEAARVRRADAMWDGRAKCRRRGSRRDLFGHGGFNIAKRITCGAENHGLYVFSATQPVPERLKCDRGRLIQSVRRNGVLEMNLRFATLISNSRTRTLSAVIESRLPLSNSDYFPAEVIQFLVACAMISCA